MDAYTTDTMKSLQELMDCPVCFERYRDPRTLVCGHHFCLTCLTDIAGIHGVGHITCPTCCDVTKIISDVTALPRAVFVMKVKEGLDKLPPITGSKQQNVNIKCEELECDGDPTRRCITCSRNTCNTCGDVHSDVSHQVVLITKELFCQSHPNNVVTFRCHDCKVGVCDFCKVTHDKVTHTMVEIGHLAGEWRITLDEGISSYNTAVEEWEGVHCQGEEQMRNLESNQAAFQEMPKELHKITTRSEHIVTGYRPTISEQVSGERVKLEEVERRCAELRETLAAIRRLRDEGTDHEVALSADKYTTKPAPAPGTSVIHEVNTLTKAQNTMRALIASLVTVHRKDQGSNTETSKQENKATNTFTAEVREKSTNTAQSDLFPWGWLLFIICAMFVGFLAVFLQNQHNVRNQLQHQIYDTDQKMAKLIQAHNKLPELRKRRSFPVNSICGLLIDRKNEQIAVRTYQSQLEFYSYEDSFLSRIGETRGNTVYYESLDLDTKSGLFLLPYKSTFILLGKDGTQYNMDFTDEQHTLCGVTYLSHEHLYVVSAWYYDKLLVIDPDTREVIREIDEIQGEVPEGYNRRLSWHLSLSSFYNPALDDSGIVISNYHRVVMVDVRGRHIRTITCDFIPDAAVVLPSGALLVGDWDNHRVVAYTREGGTDVQTTVITPDMLGDGKPRYMDYSADTGMLIVGVSTDAAVYVFHQT